jgi:hypothetical protein
LGVGKTWGRGRGRKRGWIEIRKLRHRRQRPPALPTGRGGTEIGQRFQSNTRVANVGVRLSKISSG